MDYQSVIDRLESLKGEGKMKEYFWRMEKVEIDVLYWGWYSMLREANALCWDRRFVLRLILCDEVDFVLRPTPFAVLRFTLCTAADTFYYDRYFIQRPILFTTVNTLYWDRYFLWRTMLFAEVDTLYWGWPFLLWSILCIEDNTLYGGWCFLLCWGWYTSC